MKKFFENLLNNMRHKIPVFQDYINSHNDGKKYCFIDYNILDEKQIYYEHLDNKFTLCNMLETVDQVDDYDDADISGNLLDIGACVGAWSLKHYRHAKHIFAVEPLYDDILQRNIILNHADNVTVMKCALGDGNEHLVSFGRDAVIKTIPMSEILKQCGCQIDCMKIDCEGAEWFLKPSDLIGIKRIEAEVHDMDGRHYPHRFIEMLENCGYIVKYKVLTPKTVIAHCYRD